MIARSHARFAVVLPPAGQSHKHWVDSLTRYLSQSRATREQLMSNRITRVLDTKDYVPVHQAFPALQNKFEDAALRSRSARVSTQPADAHTVNVAVVGPPNAGKSSLVNSLVTTHANATSMRAGTTVRNQASAAHVGNTEVVFIDTPGIRQPVKGNVEARRRRDHPHAGYEALDSLLTADVVVFAYSGDKIRIDPEDEGVLRRVAKLALRREVPVALAVTKMDLIPASETTAQERYRHLRRSIDAVPGIEFVETFETSTRAFRGIIELKDFLARYGRPGDWQYHRDEATLMSPPQIASMYFVEGLNKYMTGALPTSVGHKVVGWTPRVGGQSTEVFVEVFVPDVHTLTRFYACIADVARHCNQQLSFSLNKKMTYLCQAYITPGGIRSKGR